MGCRMISSTQDRLPAVADAAALASLINDPARPTLILFDVDGHGPARRLEARLLRLSGGEPINLARVDTDRLPALAQKFGVHGVPSLVLFRSGQAAARRLGEIDDGELQDWLDGELAA